MSRRAFLWASLGLLVLGLWLHWPGDAGFKSDDYPTIRYAQSFEHVLHDFVGRQYDLRFLVLYRPLITLSLFVDYQLFGTEPFGFLLMNTLALLGAAWLLMRVLVRLVPSERGRIAALVACALWLVGPALPVSVRWAVGRVDTHATLLILLAVWLHQRARHGARSWPVWLVTLLALGTKESAFGLPLLLLGMDFLDEQRGGRGRACCGRRLQALPLLLLLPAVLLWRWLVLGTVQGGYSFQETAGLDPVGIAQGLLHVFVNSLSGSHPAQGGYYFAVLGCVVLALLVLLVRFGRAGSPVPRLLGLALLGAGLFGPLAQVLPPLRESVAPRHAYLCCVLPLAAWVLGLVTWRRLGPVGVVLALLPAVPLLLTQQVTREMERGHESFNRSLLAACESATAFVPAPLPIVLGGEAELANHPQRFLWGLGSVFAPPFRSDAREIVTLRAMHPAATAVAPDALGVPGFVKVSGHGGDAVRIAREALREVEPRGFDGVIRLELIDEMAKSPARVGYAVDPAWDGEVHVLTSIGSCTLRPRRFEDTFLRLSEVFGGNVTWRESGPALPAYLLLWNAADLGRGSPIYLFWREGRERRWTRLYLDDLLLEELWKKR